MSAGKPQAPEAVIPMLRDHRFGTIPGRELGLAETVRVYKKKRVIHLKAAR